MAAASMLQKRRVLYRSVLAQVPELGSETHAIIFVMAPWLQAMKRVHQWRR
jgi:hypothetical protein